MAESVQVATLKWGVQVAGSIFELARRVGLADSSIRAFLDGSERMPNWVFLRLVDYVNDEQETTKRRANVVVLQDRRKASR